MERISVTSWKEALEFRDHTDRYELARTLMKPGSRVLDVACGVGYGAFYLASDERAVSVVGVDSSLEAIQHARLYFRSPKTEFFRKNLELDKTLFHCYFDLITCFETVEHVDNDAVFLSRVREVMHDNSLFIVSVPNEEHFPFASTFNPYHFRHYYPHEILGLLDRCGLRMQRAFVQDYKAPGAPLREEMSRFSNLFVCKRKA